MNRLFLFFALVCWGSTACDVPDGPATESPDAIASDAESLDAFAIETHHVAATCQATPPEPRELTSNENSFAGEGTTVVADLRVEAATAAFLQDEARITAHLVEELFDVEFALSDEIVLNYLDIAKYAKTCDVTAAPMADPHACASLGQGCYFLLGDSGFAALNEDAKAGVVYDRDTFRHELSHFLRSYLASPWWGLEEGLAMYTTRHLETGGTLPTATAERVYRDSLGEAQAVMLDDSMSALFESIGVASIGGSMVTLIHRFKNQYIGGPPLFTDLFVDVPVGVYQTYWDLVTRVDPDPTNPSRIILTIYRRAAEVAGQVLDGRMGMYECQEGGYMEYAEIQTSDGYVKTGEAGLTPYAALDSFQRVGWESDYYPTGFCFWERLRQARGANAVNAMVQAMATFAYAHPFDTQGFPFFDTYVSISGMSESAAQAEFARHSVPTLDKYYPLGAGCRAVRRPRRGRPTVPSAASKPCRRTGRSVARAGADLGAALRSDAGRVGGSAPAVLPARRRHLREAALRGVGAFVFACSVALLKVRAGEALPEARIDLGADLRAGGLARLELRFAVWLPTRGALRASVS